ncbi:MAG: hypothetical protein V9G22_01690 [Ottowia sp.]
MQRAIGSEGGHGQGAGHVVASDAQRIASGHHAQVIQRHTSSVLFDDVAKAPAHLGDLDDPIGQLARGGIQLGRVTVAVAGEPHKATRAALGQVVFVDHLGDRLALGLWG